MSEQFPENERREFMSPREAAEVDRKRFGELFNLVADRLVAFSASEAERKEIMEELYAVQGDAVEVGRWLADERQHVFDVEAALFLGQEAVRVSEQLA